ncbi:MAG: hypothetical protein OHK0029_27670 [Armatimonadaceae bacterium]
MNKNSPFRVRLSLLWQHVVVWAFRVSVLPLQKIPRRSALRFGEFLGTLGYRIARSKRRRAVLNLHLAFGDTMTLAEREQTTRQVFQHFGRSVTDFLRAPMLSPADLEALVAVEGWEHVEAARADGEPILLVTAHIGNWEILGRWLAQVQRLPLTVVAQDPKSPALAAQVKQMREQNGFSVLSKGGSARTLLQTLRRREVILLLNDQNSGDLFAPFFGIPAGTVAGPAALAYHAKASLIPLYCLQRRDSSFLVRCSPPIPLQPSISKEDEVYRITAELNRTLEAVIREFPDQWLWLHNRWKSAFDPANRERAWGMCATEVSFETAYARWSGKPLASAPDTLQPGKMA